MDCIISEEDDQQVTCTITIKGNPLLISYVYVKCDSHLRDNLWNKLRIINDNYNLPWLIVGDFNCIIDPVEKKDGSLHRMSKSMGFIHCIMDCELLDAGYTGSPFTWCNGWYSDRRVWQRLDCALMNHLWGSMFDNTNINHLIMTGSDRCPLLITANNSHKTPVRYFRFLDFWTDEPDFLNIVEKTWNIEVEGEVNSKFFHSIVKGREKRLNLTSIHDEHNNWISGDDNITQQAIKFFEKQFTKEDILLDDTVMNCIPKIINDEDNTLLLALPSMDEMKDVIFSMSAHSAPEPDGFSGDLPSLNLMLSKLDTYEKISGKMINRRKSGFIVWQKPTSGWLKLNTDGSSKGNSGSAGGGGIIKNSEGCFVLDFAENYGICSNNVAEVKAILQGIKICISMRLSNVIIEDDSQIIIDMINNKMKPPWQIYYIIDHIIQLSSKVNFIFVHTYREGNKLADLLANYGESIPGNIIMNSVNLLPDFVKAFLNLEKLGIPNFRFKTKSDHFFY
ncbi:hypothetical protein BC332_11159 [Capsicum chinense]|nr:hypothetical protein BC332_11159 [Capsicum chinense]